MVQGPSYLSAQGDLTRPSVGQLAGGGDDRLIQTYSHAADPNGSIVTSVPVSAVTTKQPLSVTCVKVFQPFPAKASEEAAGHWRSQSDPTVALLSHSPFTVDLRAFKNKVVFLSLNRLLVHLDLKTFLA